MSAVESLSVGRTRNGILIRIEGRGTSVASLTFDRLVRESLQQNYDWIGIDLNNCEFLDTTFLGCLVTMHRKSRDVPNDPLVIVAPRETRTRLFHTSRLDQVLRFVDQGEPLIGQAVDVQLSGSERAELGRHIAEAHRALASLGGGEATEFGEIADSVEHDLGESH